MPPEDLLLEDLLKQQDSPQNDTSVDLQELLASQDIQSGQNVAYDQDSGQTVAFPMGIPDEQANYHLRLEVDGETDDNFLGHIRVGGENIAKGVENIVKGAGAGVSSAFSESLISEARRYKLNRDAPLEIEDSPFYLFEVLTGNADANRFTSLFLDREKVRRNQEVERFDQAAQVVLSRMRQGIQESGMAPTSETGFEKVAFDVGSAAGTSVGFLALSYLAKGRGLSTLASTLLGGGAAAKLAEGTEFNQIVSELKDQKYGTVEALQKASGLSSLIGLGEGALEFLDLYLFMGWMRGVKFIPRLAGRVGSNSLQEALQTLSSESIKKIANVSDAEWNDIFKQMAYSALIGAFVGFPTSAIVGVSESTGWYGKLLKMGFSPNQIETMVEAQKQAVTPEAKKELAKTMTDQMQKKTETVVNLNLEQTQPPTDTQEQAVEKVTEKPVEQKQKKEKQPSAQDKAIEAKQKEVESLKLQGRYNKLASDQEAIVKEINDLLKQRDARWSANRPTKTIDTKLKDALSRFEVIDSVLSELVYNPNIEVKASESINIKARELMNEVKRSVRYGYKIGAETARKETTDKFNKKLEALGEKQAISKEMKQLIIDYANNHLGKGDKDTIINMVKGENVTAVQALNAMRKIDELSDKIKKRSLTKKIKEMLRKIDSAKNIAIDYKERIFDLVQNFDLTSRRKETLDALKATKDWIDSKDAAGEDVFLPRYVYESLRVLEQKPYDQLSTADLETVFDNIKFMVDLGKTKLKAFQKVYEYEKSKRLKELQESNIRKVQSKDKFSDPLKDPNFNDYVNNAFADVRNYFFTIDSASMPMDHFFYSIGGETYHKIFKRNLDAKYNNYLNDSNDVKDRFDELMKESKLDKESFRRIGIVATLRQENGLKKLNASGISKKLAESITLTPSEQKVLDFMDAELKSVFPRLKKMMKDVHNLGIGEVPNYFPFVTDFDSIKDMEVKDRLTSLPEHRIIKKNVSVSSAKERTDVEGKIAVKIDAGQTFMNHMENVLYAINMARDIKMLQEIAKSEQFKNTAGDISQKITTEWLDLAARKGGRAQNDSPRELLDYIRKTSSISALALNPSSIIIQTTALGDAAGFIGNYAFSGLTDMSSPEWRNFVMDNSPNMRNRVGDDQAFREFGQGMIDKTRSALMTPQRYVDSFIASGVWIGAYQKYMADNGLTVELKNPNPQAIRYADEMTVRTQASASWLNLPTAITRGIGFKGSSSWGKAWTQFQTPLMYRFANLRVHGLQALQSGDYGKFGAIATSQAATVLAEIGIRYGAKAVQGLALAATLSALGIKYDDDKQEERRQTKLKNFRKQFREKTGVTLSKEQAQMAIFALEYLSTLAGNIPYVSNAMSTVEYNQAPVAALAMSLKQLENLKNFKSAKKQKTKNKWASILALEVTGLLSGAPTRQLANIIRATY